MLPIIVEAAIRSLLLAAAIWLGLKLLRITNPHVLMAVWQLVLILSLCMPLLVDWAKFTLPPATLPIPRLLATEPTFFFAPPPQRAMPHDMSPTLDWRTVCSSIYLLVATFLMLRLLVGATLTWRLCRSALPVREHWTAGRDVRASAHVNVPVTFGSMIILPVSYAGWDATQRRAVMAHEDAHVSHGDFYVLLLAAINRAVFWFSPLAWWLNNRIAYLAEARSDAAAIEDIDDRLQYVKSCWILAPMQAARRRLSNGGKQDRSPSGRTHSGGNNAAEPDGFESLGGGHRLHLPLAAIAVAAVAQVPSQTQKDRRSVTPAPTPDQETLRQRQDDQKKPRQEVQIDPAILDNYVGLYQFGAYRVFTVTRQDDHLMVQLTGQEALQVYPESAQKFFYKTVAAQISFVTDPQGRATGLVLHQDGLERPAPRIDQAAAQKLEETFAKRLKGEAPMPGSEAALRHQIETFERGQPDYDAMTEALATLTRPQVPKIERQFALLGSLQSISFRGVGFSGWDIYEAKFANGISIAEFS